MTRVIGSPCIGVKSGECVDVCPVDCIHPRPDSDKFEETQQLFIDPNDCIDCGACESVCPVTAIWPEDEVPENEQEYIQKNADYFA